MSDWINGYFLYYAKMPMRNVWALRPMQAYLEREKELVIAKNSDQDAGLIAF